MKAFKTFFTILKEVLLTLIAMVGFPIVITFSAALLIVAVVIVLPIETAIHIDEYISYSDGYCENIIDLFEGLTEFYSNIF